MKKKSKWEDTGLIYLQKKENPRFVDINLMFAEIEKGLTDLSKETKLENKVNKISHIIGVLFNVAKDQRKVSYITYCHLKKRTEQLEKKNTYHDAG